MSKLSEIGPEVGSALFDKRWYDRADFAIEHGEWIKMVRGDGERYPVGKNVVKNTDPLRHDSVIAKKLSQGGLELCVYAVRPMKDVETSIKRASHAEKVFTQG
jgi:hypothetical protein